MYQECSYQKQCRDLHFLNVVINCLRRMSSDDVMMKKGKNENCTRYTRDWMAAMLYTGAEFQTEH